MRKYADTDHPESDRTHGAGNAVGLIIGIGAGAHYPARQKADNAQGNHRTTLSDSSMAGPRRQAGQLSRDMRRSTLR